jgi:hypothetical protein
MKRRGWAGHLQPNRAAPGASRGSYPTHSLK